MMEMAAVTAFYLGVILLMGLCAWAMHRPEDFSHLIWSY